MFLPGAEAQAVEAAVARIEARTGVQIVTAVVGKSDTYVELPWKAFALGASLAAFAGVAADLWRPQWVTAATPLVDAVTVLAAGAALALLAMFVPPFARLFLRVHRAEVEVRQHAQSLFLRRQLFSTPARTAVLILVSLFERRIEILPDTGLHARITEDDWGAVIARMTPALRQASAARALEEGLAAAETLLIARGFAAGGATANALPDAPIEERGV